MAATTKEFIKAIGYSGIADIDYIFDSRDGLYKIVDVNPRIGCTFRLFVSDTGMDVVRALYLDLTGQIIAGGNFIPNRKWIVEPADLASSRRDWARGGIKLRDWLGSFRGLQEFAYLALDDPYPMLAIVASAPISSPRRVSDVPIREGPNPIHTNTTGSMTIQRAASRMRAQRRFVISKCGGKIVNPVDRDSRERDH